MSPKGTNTGGIGTHGIRGTIPGRAFAITDSMRWQRFLLRPSNLPFLCGPVTEATEVAWMMRSEPLYRSVI